MTIEEAIERYTSNAEYERTHGNLQGCLEFRQLAEWLKDYKRLKEQEPCGDAISRQAVLDLPRIKTHNVWGNVIYESVDVDAVRQLPSVSPQPCEDAISRQVVLEAIDDDNRNGHYSCFATNNDAECFKQIIRELPPVTPQQKVGKWISNAEDDLKISEYTCSNCKGLSDEDSDFCPKCGAKMSEIPTVAEGSDKE